MLNLKHNHKDFPHRDCFLKLSLITVASILSFSINAYATPISLPILSGSSGWEASLDNKTWVPAYGSYPNPITVPVVTTSDPAPSLMWYWGEGDYTGTPDGHSGPDTVFFRYTFRLGEEETDSHAGAWVAADDWMRLTVNGHTIGTYTLDDHLLPNNQPDPVFMNFTTALNSYDSSHGDPFGNPFLGDGSGQNVISIEAHDGGATARDRAYEWVFFDAQHIPGTVGTVSLSPVPEPASLTLFIAGLGVMGAMRYRRG